MRSPEGSSGFKSNGKNHALSSANPATENQSPNTSAGARLRRILRELVRTGLVVLVVVTAASWWQTRNHVQGPAPVMSQPGEWLRGEVGAHESTGPRLVYFLAPWCGVCRLSAPTLSGLAEDGFAVSVVAADWEGDGVESVSTFVQEAGLTMPVRLATAAERDMWAVTSYPTWFVIGPDGNIQRSGVGWTSSFGFRWRLLWAHRL